MNTIGWNFPENNYGKEDGINDAGIETFADDPLASLAREAIQNSLDAVDLSRGKPVHVRFQKFVHKTKDIPGYEDIVFAHKQSKDYWIGNKDAENFFSNSLKLLAQDQITSLKVSDYNTTGLLGSKKGRGHWFNLMKSVGSSDKGESEGGSFGIGKNAPFACSNLRQIFCRTFDIEDVYACQGISKLVTHINRKGEPTQGQGYYGVTNKNEPLFGVDNSSILNDKERKRAGTDIYIMGMRYSDDWHTQIKRAVLENFFFAIEKGRLVVQVDDEVITSQSLGRFMEEILSDQERTSLGIQYYESITSDNKRHFYEQDFMGLGEIELFLLPGSNMPKKVAMIRETGMVIFDKGHFRTPVRFTGVFHAKGKKLNGLLRQLEPPKHDKWVPQRHSDDIDYAVKVIKGLYAWINEKVRELISQEYLEEIDVEELSKYLPDELDDEDLKKKDEAKDEFNEEPTPDVGVVIRPYTKQVVDSEYINNEGGDGTDISAGEGEGGEGEGLPTEEGLGDEGTITPGDGDLTGGEDGEQGLGGDGGNRGGIKRPVNLSKVRAFVINEAGTKYQVGFIPDLDGDANIEIKIVGEVGVDKAFIKSARFIGENTAFEINELGQISSVNLNKGEKTSLVVELNEDGKRSLEVSAYAN